MGRPVQTFRELSDGDRVTLSCADGAEITGDVQHSSEFVEDGVRCWSREVQDDDWEAWKMRLDENQSTLHARLEGYDEDKKVATIRQEHTVTEITVLD